MAVIENRFVCDLSKPVQAQALKGNVFSLDNLGSRLSVLIYNNGQPATISGSVTANCILPDGSTVNVNGSLITEGDGSKAYVDVPQSCLLIPGILKIAIKCTSSSVITTLAAIVANVYMTKTDNVITPSQQIINDWNAEISAAISTQNAAIANQDTKINDLKTVFEKTTGDVQIAFTNGYYIPTNGAVGSEVNLTPQVSAPLGYAIINTSEGDMYTINGTGGNAGRLWCFIDKDNKIISSSTGNYTASNLILFAPAGAKKLVMNVVTPAGLCFKGDYVKDYKKHIEDIDIKSEYYDNSIIEESITNISGTAQTGAYDFNNMTTWSGGKHIDMSVSDYQDTAVLISGKCQAVNSQSNYGLYAFLDDEDNIIRTYGENNKVYSNAVVSVPKRAVRLIVNGDSTYLPTVCSFSQVKANEFYEDYCDFKTKYTNGQEAYNIFNLSGVYLDNCYNFKNMATWDGGKHAEWNVEGLDYVVVSGKSQTVNESTNFGLYAFLNSNNSVIETYGESNTQYIKLLVKVPKNAAKIIVNGQLNNNNEPIVYGCDFAEGIKDIKPDASKTVVGLRNFSNGSFFGDSYGLQIDVEGASFCVVSGRTSAVGGGSNYGLYGFYDSNDQLISAFPNAVGYTAYSEIRANVPANAKYCYVNGASGAEAHCDVYVVKNIVDYVKTHANTSIWKGKKIGVLGTSVAFGSGASTSYSYEASKIDRFDLKMFAVPGLALHTENNGSPRQYGSLSCTIEEYIAAGKTISESPVTPYVPGGSYNTYYCTYENVFVQDNADIDLWIFAVAPNNGNFALTDWELFDKTNWKYSDDSSFAEHRTTFLGAFIFIMNQMYLLNPNARMMIVIDSDFSLSAGALSNLELLRDTWHIEFLNMWYKINTSPKSIIKVKQSDGADSHPSTFGQTLMGKMLAGYLEQVQ